MVETKTKNNIIEKEISKAIKRIYSYESRLKEKGYDKYTGSKTLQEVLQEYICKEIKNKKHGLLEASYYTRVVGYFYKLYYWQINSYWLRDLNGASIQI